MISGLMPGCDFQETVANDLVAETEKHDSDNIAATVGLQHYAQQGRMFRIRISWPRLLLV
jgi:hypothetical protein